MPLENRSRKDTTDQSQADASHSGSLEKLQKLRRIHSYSSFEDVPERQKREKVHEMYEAERHSDASHQEAPSLTELPKSWWWLLYIDVPFHQDARDMRRKKNIDPGKLFDNQRSPGYQRGMIEALEKYVACKDLLEMEFDFGMYSDIHRCATQYIRHKEFGKCQSEWMRKPNGISSDESRPFTFARPLEGPERQERLAALAEMRNEYINGIPLYQDHPHYDVEKQEWKIEMNKEKSYDILEQICDHGFMNLKNNSLSKQELSEELDLPADTKAVTLAVTSIHDRSIGMLPWYSPHEVEELVSSCLREYHEKQRKPNLRREEKLRNIAKLGRQLHMTHAFYDGSGRLTLLVIERELVKHGLGPAILPQGPAIFGGIKKIDTIAKDLDEGFLKFRNTVNKLKLQSDARLLPHEEFKLNVDRQQEIKDKDLDEQLKRVNTPEGKARFDEHTRECLQESNRTLWLEGTVNQFAMAHHGMDLIEKYQHDENFKELFLASMPNFFKDSPPHEKFQIPRQDSPGKFFMQEHGVDFLKTNLGENWINTEEGKKWFNSYSGKIFRKLNVVW